MPSDGTDEEAGSDGAASTGKRLVEVVAFADAPVVPTSEIASASAIEHEQVYYRLEKLEESGLLASKKIGGNRVWWCTNSGVKYLKGSIDPSEFDFPEWVEIDHCTRPTKYGSQNSQWRRQRSLL